MAANLSKTFIRIIESNIKFNPNNAKYRFRNLTKQYEINCQKENTLILVLILHMFARQSLLTFDVYENIVKVFLGSIKTSLGNCAEKTIEEEKRKEFHSKNRKMYMKFAEIVQEIFQKSTRNLTKGEVFDLK